MKIRCIAWLLPVLFCCCHKNDNSNKKLPGFTFTTTYDSVITTYPNKTYDFSFSVNVLTGSITGNPVTYSVGSLPTGVTDSPGSIVVNGSLGGLFKFTIGDVTPGSYTMNLASSCTATGLKSHNLILKVLALPDYSILLSGTYPNSHDYCTPSNILYTFSAVVSKLSGTASSINISNLRIYDTTLTVTASLSNVVTIPKQTFGGYTIWGSGTYTHDNPPYDTLYMLTLYDTTAHGSDTEACLIHIQH